LPNSSNDFRGTKTVTSINGFVDLKRICSWDMNFIINKNVDEVIFRPLWQTFMGWGRLICKLIKQDLFNVNN